MEGKDRTNFKNLIGFNDTLNLNLRYNKFHSYL